MSLQSFQRAVVDLTLSPWIARELREDGARWLAGYDLTGRERDRLLDIVTQRGISINCSLSRGNRFEIVAQAFPMTCVLLRSVLRSVVDELWQEHRPTNYQLFEEEIAFAAIVKRKIAAGQLVIEYLKEIFAYEVACLELVKRMRMDPNAEVTIIVEFQHSPDDLLPPLIQLKGPPSKLPAGSYRALITLQGEQFKVELL
jgi:hypothetical protein